MKLTLFGKTRTTAEGKPFLTYLTRMAKKDKTLVTVQVKFRQDCTPPRDLPAIILVNRTDASMEEKILHMEEGEDKVSRTLWVSAWSPSGEVYVDHSLDDYED